MHAGAHDIQASFSLREHALVLLERHSSHIAPRMHEKGYSEVKVIESRISSSVTKDCVVLSIVRG